MSALREGMIVAGEKSWRTLHDLVKAVPNDRREAPPICGEWSARDLLAHLACWTAEAARQLESIRAGTPPKMPDVEAFNAEAHESCRSLTFEEAMSMAGAAHHRLQEELALVAPVALNAKVIDMVRTCSTRHYAEHLEHFRSLLAQDAS